ncbi:MAG: hypothetical protein K8R57_06740 [Verrucomicrobia bacterium]|nr:hypothetical protein [Verrucomicrobiota bacterium]
MARPSSPQRKGDGRSTGKNTRNPPRRVRVSASTHDSPDLFDREELILARDQPLNPDLSGQTSATIPKSWVKFIIALFLLPVALILTATFFQAFTASMQHGLLATQSFGCFAAGMILFGILFFIVPREILMWPYVFGHEVTHAIWVKLFGGNVADHFHVSLDGGHVLTDRVNTWIALAPYFFPLYSLLVVTLYGAASLAADLSPYRWVLFLLLGFTLAFHLVFTCLLIAKGQPDLHYGGTFFSLTVIYLINLLIITGLLLLTGKEISLKSLGHDFVENMISFVEITRIITTWFADWISDLWKGFGYGQSSKP